MGRAFASENRCGMRIERRACGRIGLCLFVLLALLMCGGGNPRAQEEKFYTVISSTEGGGDYSTISTDGKWIAYRRSTSDEIWVAKRADLSYRRKVSISTDGTEVVASSVAHGVAISANGRYVAFTNGSNLTQDVFSPGRSFDRVYLHDRDTDGNGVYDEAGKIQTMLVTNQVEMCAGEADKYGLSMSGNGEVVAFSNSHAGDGYEIVWQRGGYYEQTEQYLTSLNARGNSLVYVGSANESAQILRRDFPGPLAGTCVSTSSGGAIANMGSMYPGISPDGNYVAFYSQGDNLTLNDLNTHNWDVFLKDLTTGETVRCSAGVANTGDADSHSFYKQVALSEGGRFVAFVSDSPNLMEGVTPMADRIFLYDAATSQTYLCSMPGNVDHFWPAISGDGRYVVYTEQDEVFLMDRGEGSVSLKTRISDPATSASLVSDTYHIRFDFEGNAFKEPVIVRFDAATMESGSVFGGASMGVGIVAVAGQGGIVRATADAPEMLKPYKITFSYLDQDLGGLQEGNLALCYWDEAKDMWIKEPSSALNVTKNEITASHLGAATWVVMAKPFTRVDGADWPRYK
jgi:Tol biopolymer transport system component